MGDTKKNIYLLAERNALCFIFLWWQAAAANAITPNIYVYMFVSEPCGVLLSPCVYLVCVLVGEHLVNKRLSEQSDELGVHGHTFNELGTRPELKEKGWKIWGKGEGRVLSGIPVSVLQFPSEVNLLCQLSLFPLQLYVPQGKCCFMRVYVCFWLSFSTQRDSSKHTMCEVTSQVRRWSHIEAGRETENREIIVEQKKPFSNHLILISTCRLVPINRGCC